MNENRSRNELWTRTKYGYDTLGRLTSTSYDVSGATGAPATASVNLTYGTDPMQNNNGRVISMTDGPGSAAYSYNTLGQLSSVARIVGGITYTTGYTYNQAGAVKTITYPSGRIVQQDYDVAGRLSSIHDIDNTYASSFNYTVAGAVSAFSYGNGVQASFGYNTRQQLQSLSYTNNGNALFSLTYDYGIGVNNNGQIRGITDIVQPSRSVSYTYDQVGRLVKAITQGSGNYQQWEATWKYDRYGNRTDQSFPIGYGYPVSLGFDSPTNHITGLTFDANGNLTQDSGDSYKYDAENRLVTYGVNTANYVYDGNGQRVEKTYGSTTVYIFSGARVIAEYALGAPPSSPTQEYIYSGTLLASVAGGSTKYYFPDELSTRMTMTGSTVTEQGHFPFGDSWYATPSADKWQFTSYERDSETRNDYAMFRSYINRYGRFLTPDPAGLGAVDPTNPQTWNRYAYVMNNPTGAIDPLGLMMCDNWECFISGGGDNGGYTDSGYCPPKYAYCGDDPFGGIPIGGGDGGGGGGGGGGVPAPSPTPNPAPQPGRPIGGSWPNGETLGIPTGLPLNPGSIWSVFLPVGTQCEFGPCVPIGNGIVPVAAGAGGICIVLEPCGASVGTAIAITAGVVALASAGYLGYQYFAKGGTQNVAHDYVRELARQIPGDYCSALKTIMDNARKSGNSKLFNDAKATWKQDCRGR